MSESEEVDSMAQEVCIEFFCGDEEVAEGSWPVVPRIGEEVTFHNDTYTVRMVRYEWFPHGGGLWASILLDHASE